MVSLNVKRNQFGKGLLLCLFACGSLPLYAQTTAPQKPVRVRAKLDGFEMEPKSGKAANMTGGASRGIGELTLYAPWKGKAYSLTPTFNWRADSPAFEYIFQLSTPQQVVFETKVLGGTFTYPSSAPALVPGTTYTWKITSINDMLGDPARASLVVVGGEERVRIDKAMHGNEGTSEADAKVFVDNRLWYDAVAAYSALIEANPGKTEYLLGRAALYDQLPQTEPLADLDLKQAQH